MKGAIAAGHTLTAEAGAEVLRAGGNAVDAAVAAVLTSFVAESPLTGLGAGGFMLVHTPDDDVLLDFFVAVPGRNGGGAREPLVPVSVLFDETPQIFNIGAASCGVPGTAAGLAEALGRFGSMAMAELAAPAIRHARDGVPVSADQAYLHSILEPVMIRYPETRTLYAAGGSMLGEGETFRFPELAEALERYAAEGPDPFYRGDVAARLAAWVSERGGTLGRADLAAYRPIARRPIRARFRGHDVLTNPPPSSGGILVALCLELLERVSTAELEQVVSVMEEANGCRTAAFHEALYGESYANEFLVSERLDRMAARAATSAPSRTRRSRLGGALGSTTHVTAVDAEGRCASVTCSNGTGSGLLVPGTGVHLNNMLGEEDLNPLGFHAVAPGRRMTSMMAPTVVLREGKLAAGLGSGGSNRIRSAILQVALRLIADGLPVASAVEAPRVHCEEGVVQAEPGVDEAALARLEQRGYGVARWRRRNLFFGGVQAIARDAATGALEAAGDPRRGGAAVVL